MRSVANRKARLIVILYLSRKMHFNKVFHLICPQKAQKLVGILSTGRKKWF